MKKIAFIITACTSMLSSLAAFSQGGRLTTVAGCYGCITTAINGTPAKMATFNRPAGVSLDASNNVYIAENASHKVRRVLSSTGLVYTYAGNGTSGFAGDGGAATAAMLNSPDGILIDGTNNLYIADKGNNRIRKVDAVTGIITTIAGGGVSIADGIPATDASITPECVYMDGAGNIYTGGINTLRKIDATTGTITTVAGDGTAVDGGDGGPAISAGIAGPIRSITMDAASNIYLVSAAGSTVRKIDAATGIITTVAGGGICIADGAPATASSLINMHSCLVDVKGNIIVADRGHQSIRIVDAASQNMYMIAGGGVATAEGILATPALARNYGLYMDRTGSNIYFTDSVQWIRKLTYGPILFSGKGVDSFSVAINKLCSGPQMQITTSNFYPGMKLVTWFGDGTMLSTPITMGCVGGSGSGNATITHTYANSGTYRIKQVLYNGTLAVDSIQQLYQHTLCNSFYIPLYYDANNNCVNDKSEDRVSRPTLTQISRNGSPIDSVSSTGGFYYTAYGNVGDIYTFKVIDGAKGLKPVCPALGVISDTLQSLVYNEKKLAIGFTCGGAGNDYSVNMVVPVTGRRDQWGHIYISNDHCGTSSASLSFSFSPKYIYKGGASPSPISYTGNSISWNSITASANSPKPLDFYFVMWNNPTTGLLTARDTVNEKAIVTTFIPDLNQMNDTARQVDTVRASCDPNYVAVIPGSCIPAGTKKLEYTIHFENTGNDTATNIFIMDTLSDDVDPKSMRMVMASHQMDVSVINYGTHNALKFDFPNINLPDSSHHGLCDGAVIFTIDLKNDVTPGAHVLNNAGIFFDYNEVVLTNTTDNINGCPMGVAEMTNIQNEIIYPNPTNDELTITTEKQYSAFTITNSIGQVMMEQPINGTQTKVSVKTLSAGLYYISLRGSDGVTVHKFVKL